MKIGEACYIFEHIDSEEYTEVQLDVEIDEESEDDVRVENSRAIRS